MNNDKIKLKAWYNVTQNIMVIYIYTIMLSHGTQISRLRDRKYSVSSTQDGLRIVHSLTSLLCQLWALAVSWHCGGVAL